jgi:hypothetical protein
MMTYSGVTARLSESEMQPNRFQLRGDDHIGRISRLGFPGYT